MSLITQEFIKKAVLNPLQDQKCSQLHPGISCNTKMIFQFFGTCKSLYKMYLFVHLIPFIIFKRKHLKQNPRKEIQKLIKAFIKSMLFAGGYTLIVRRTICFLTQHYKYSSTNGAVGVFLAGVTLNFQPVGRQSQIALFCVNKTLETLYHMALRRKYPVRIPNGECLLVGIALALISYFYVDCPAAIKQNYFKVLNKVIGNI